MLIRFSAVLLITFSVIQSASATFLTIDTINVSTVAGYGDTHYPVTYPGYDRFSILGAALSYTLSDGQVRPFGAGWIPYTNGNLSSVSMVNGTVNYEFDQVNNWAKGNGTIFYSMGQVWCPACNETGSGLWTEGQFAPVSPIVLTSPLGSTTATLSGTARIVMNNASGNWGLPENFLSFSSPEGSIVQYSTIYTLTNGAVWDQNTFNNGFSYNMTGTINLHSIPEPGTIAIFALGLVLLMRASSTRVGSCSPGKPEQGEATSVT